MRPSPPRSPPFTIPATVIDESVVTAPSAGAVIVTCGGVVSRITIRLSVLATPIPTLFATAVNVFVPSISGTDALNVAPVTCAVTPFTVTCALGFATVPLTIVGVVLKYADTAGDVIFTAVPVPVIVKLITGENTRPRLP